MEHFLPQERNLLEQFDLKSGGPRTANQPEPVEGVVVGDEGGEAAIENHCHRLPNHLLVTYTAVVTSPFLDLDHCLSGLLL